MANIFGTDPGNDYLTDTIGGGNTFFGFGGNDTIDGGDGADVLYGYAGNDSLFGGTGNDQLWGDNGHFGTDILLGGDGNDTLHGEDGSDTLIGGAGDDELRGGSGGDSMVGGDGADVLYGDLGGSASNDTLDGGAGSDELWGEGGDDTYLIGDLNDQIIDSSGNDTAIVSVNGFKVPDSIENVQYINGAQPLAYYIDALYSGLRWGEFGQPVTLTYGFLSEATPGATANSSTGFGAMSEGDKAVVREALESWASVSGVTFVENTTPITNALASSVDLRFGLNSQPFSSGYAYYPSDGDIYIDFDYSQSFSTISHEIGHALGLKHPFEAPALPLAEDSDKYTLMSYTGRPDQLFRDVTDLGGGSYDIDFFFVTPETPQLYDVAVIQYLYGVNVSANTGNNNYAFLPTDTPFFKVLWDAGGVDGISLAGFVDGGVINLQAGSFSSIPILSDDLPPGYSGGSEPTYFGVDNLAIAYGAVIENATGGAGNDTLIGNELGNWLDGGAGVDSMSGGLGDDVYVVNAAGDSIVEGAGAGRDMVRSTSTFSLGANLETLLLLGSDSINGSGNTEANIIAGNSGNNILDGGAGADIIAGGAGNDTYVVDHGGDQIMELGNSGADSVQSAVSYNLMQAWHVEHLTLTGGSAINGLGNWQANQITGNSAENSLDGNRGNDTLAGGGGLDSLRGGQGDDAFYFDTHGAPTADTILDFQIGFDQLLFSQSSFAALGGSGVVAAGRVQIGLNSQINATSGNAGDGLQDVLKYATDTGQLYYDADGTGAGALSLVATLYAGGSAAASLSLVDDLLVV